MVVGIEMVKGIKSWEKMFEEDMMNDLNDPLQGFDESTYLKLNPDVNDAVKNHLFSSGWEHFLAHGFSENRTGVSPEVYKLIKEFLTKDNSFPPEKLRIRVHGDKDLLRFMALGRIVAFNIHSAINPVIDLEKPHRILDFGCGCGRIIRYFNKLSPNSSFYGTDIDEEAISWCQHQQSQIGEFFKNGESPPLPFGDEYFDFVYSISVFTHLPEEMQFAWLEELRRVTKRGSYLLLTTHGKDLFNTASGKSKRQFQQKGFFYSIGNGTEGLPGFYQTSFHSKDYINNHWAKFFEIKKIIEKGIGGHQDLILCRRPN